jgi:hypothetical protein
MFAQSAKLLQEVVMTNSLKMFDRAGSRVTVSVTQQFRDLCKFLVSFAQKHGAMSNDDCVALALGAFGGHAHAEFLVATAYDAAEECMHAKRWYERSARHGYVPAMVQLQYANR